SKKSTCDTKQSTCCYIRRKMHPQKHTARPYGTSPREHYPSYHGINLNRQTSKNKRGSGVARRKTKGIRGFNESLIIIKARLRTCAANTVLKHHIQTEFDRISKSSHQEKFMRVFYRIKKQQ